MSNMSLSMRIGAVVDGSLNRVLGGVNRDFDRLGSSTAQLTARQERLNRIMDRGMRSGNRDLTRYRREQERVTRAIEETRRAQERLNRSVERGRRIGEAQQQAGSNFATSTAQLAGFAIPVAASVKAAMDFETAMAEVGKTVEFTAGNSLPKLGEELKQLSLEIPLSASELAAITASGGQLGVADKDLIGFTTTVAKMGVAFDMSADQAGDSMAKLSNVMQIPIKEMDRIGDMINTISNNSPAKAAEIVTALSSVGSSVKSAGFTEQFSVGLTGALIAQGRDASVTSNAIESMVTTFSTLDMATTRQKEAFKALGTTSGDFAAKFKADGQAATQEFFNLVNTLPTEERTGVVSSIIGRNYGGDILAVANNVDLLGKNIDLLGTNADGTAKYLGSMNAEFNSISSTKANEVQLLKNNFNVLAITLGDALLPALGEAITAITPLVQSFASWAKENPELIAGTVKIVGGMLLAKAAFWGVSFAVLSVIRPIASLATMFSRLRAGITVLRNMAILGRLAPMIARVGGAIRMVGTALRVVGAVAMANPLFIAIGLLATAAYLIYRNWTPIKAFFIGLWNGLKSAVTRGVGAIKGALGRFNPLPIFSRAWNTVTGYFAALPAKFRQYGINIIQGLIGGITAKFGALKAKITSMGDSVSGWFKDKLGINSPSKVFTKLGFGIPEGTGLGIEKGTPLALKASEQMAKRLAQTEYSNKVLGAQSITGGMSAGSISFSPTINVQVAAGAGDVAGQVQQGLNASYAEFERMLEQVEGNRRRRAFA